MGARRHRRPDGGPRSEAGALAAVRARLAGRRAVVAGFIGAAVAVVGAAIWCSLPERPDQSQITGQVSHPTSPGSCVTALALGPEDGDGRLARAARLHPALVWLDLSRSPLITDLSPLSRLGALRHLALPPALDQAGLEAAGRKLPGLRSLRFADASVSDLGPLRKLAMLERLVLIRCDEVTDLSPLASLSNLETLDFCACRKVQNLAPLAGLAKLRALSLRACSKVEDLSPLGEMRALRSLDLARCFLVSDLSALGKLGDLRELDLSWCISIRDVSPLAGPVRPAPPAPDQRAGPVRPAPPAPDQRAGLGHLERLELTMCRKVRDLSPIMKLKALTELSLPPAVTSKGLEGVVRELPQLRRLGLSHCELVRDLSPVAKLTRLRTLDLGGCIMVHDLSPLSELSELRRARLDGCENVVDLAPLARIKSLVSVELTGCDGVEPDEIERLNQARAKEALPSCRMFALPVETRPAERKVPPEDFEQVF